MLGPSQGSVKSGSKLHVTIGHSTVLATVTFFGHRELYGTRRRALASAAGAAAGAGPAASAGPGAESPATSGPGKGGLSGRREEAHSAPLASTSLAAASGSFDLPTDLDFDWGVDYLWQVGTGQFVLPEI